MLKEFHKVLQFTQTHPNQKLPEEFQEFRTPVKVALIEGKGRGLFADKTVQKGDLILADRALAIIFPEGGKEGPVLSPLLQKVKRFRKLKEALLKATESDEEIRKNVLQLDAGPKLGFKSESEASSSGEKVSERRAEGVIVTNGFEGTGGSFGLWFLPSFINHDCYRVNANWRVIGDFIFVRAAKRIEEGEEILISYIDPDQPSFVRKELFLKHNFLCSCKICGLEKEQNPEVIKKRDEVLSEFRDYVNSFSSENKTGNENEREVKLLSLIERIEEFDFNLSGRENPFLLQPCMQLGLLLFERREYEEALHWFRKGWKIADSFPQFQNCATCLSIAVIRALLKLIESSDTSNAVGSSKCELEQGMKIMKDCVQAQNGSESDVGEILRVEMPEFYKEVEGFLNL